jgi:hypothetical protein
MDSNPDAPVASSVARLPARNTSRRGPRLWFLVCTAFVLSGSVNLGWSGPALAAPFLVLLLVLAWRQRWWLQAAGVLSLATFLYSAQSWWPQLYYSHIGEELALANPACVFINSPGHPNYVSDGCAETPGLPSRNLGAIPADTYRIVGASTSHADFGFSAAHLIDTPRGPAVVSPGLVQARYASGAPMSDAARGWHQRMSVLMYWPMPILSGAGYLLSWF